jgi:DNA-binding LacI/PurR family transcriptional regulator
MPNQAARTLKGAPTRMIGFIIPSTADLFSSCAEAAQVVARANDSLLIVLTTRNDQRPNWRSGDSLAVLRNASRSPTPALNVLTGG